MPRETLLRYMFFRKLVYKTSETSEETAVTFQRKYVLEDGTELDCSCKFYVCGKENRGINFQIALPITVTLGNYLGLKPRLDKIGCHVIWQNRTSGQIAFTEFYTVGKNDNITIDKLDVIIEESLTHLHNIYNLIRQFLVQS